MAAQLLDRRRDAPWWMCALMVVVAAFFGWVIYQTHTKPVSDGVWSHVILPPYCVWLYLVLVCLLNSQSIYVAGGRLIVSDGPIPSRPDEVIPRDRIAFCFYNSVMAAPDGGSDDTPFAIGHVAGVETTEGRQLVLVDPYKDSESARDFANTVARALNEGNAGGPPVKVKALDEARSDPVGIRRAWMWAGIWGGAIAAGVAWEIAYRWRVI